jgi:hypothetical protein
MLPADAFLKDLGVMLRTLIAGAVVSPIRTDRSISDSWIKVKNPAAPALRRKAEEDWSGKRNGR